MPRILFKTTMAACRWCSGRFSTHVGAASWSTVPGFRFIVVPPLLGVIDFHSPSLNVICGGTKLLRSGIDQLPDVRARPEGCGCQGCGTPRTATLRRQECERARLGLADEPFLDGRRRLAVLRFQ